MTKDDARVLPDGQTAQNRLDAGKQSFGIRSEEEEARFFISLTETVETVVAGSRADFADDGFEIEVGVDLIWQARSIEEDRQALLFAEFPQDPAIRRLNELGSLRRTSLLERVGSREQRTVQVQKLDFYVSVVDASKLVQLGATARHSPELRLFKDGLKRVFVPIASVDRFDVLVHTGKDEVREVHHGLLEGRVG